MKVDLPHLYYTISYVIAAVVFLQAELIAALWDPDRGDTLTEHLESIMWVSVGGKLRPTVMWYVVVGVAIWLVVHFTFRRKFG